MHIFSIIIAAILIPLIYAGGWIWQRENFKDEEQRSHRPFQGIADWLAVIAAEAALFMIWRSHGQCTFGNLEFSLLYIVLAGMTLLCLTDFYGKYVPNKVLLLMLAAGVIVIGFALVRDAGSVIRFLPYMVLGFLFSLLTFGLSYLLSKGSLGAGDVKLALVMGLLLGGDYVVGAIVYGSIVAASFAVVQLLRKKMTRKSAMPYVPFLFIGLIIRYFVG